MVEIGLRGFFRSCPAVCYPLIWYYLHQPAIKIFIFEFWGLCIHWDLGGIFNSSNGNLSWGCHNAMHNAFSWLRNKGLARYIWPTCTAQSELKTHTGPRRLLHLLFNCLGFFGFRADPLSSGPTRNSRSGPTCDTCYWSNTSLTALVIGFTNETLAQILFLFKVK